MRYNSSRKQATGATRYEESDFFYGESSADLGEMVEVHVGDVRRLKRYLRSCSHWGWTDSLHALVYLELLSLEDRKSKLISRLEAATKGGDDDLKPFPKILCRPFWEMCGRKDEFVGFLEKYVDESES